MAIKGSLKEASLTDVLQLLAMGAKTGCLSVTDRSSFGYIYFADGRIIYASLLNRRDRLGDILVREEAITREQLEQAIEEQSVARDGRRLGEILRDNGFLDQETLRLFVQHQIEEAVYHLFTWSQGSFYFEPGQRPDEEPILVKVDPESLLLEGARRVDEWSQIEKKIPTLDLIFALDTDRASTLSALDLVEEQERILPYLDGKHTVWEIVDDTALGEFDVGKALYGLISAGLVRRVGKRRRDRRRVEDRARVGEHRNLGVAFYKTAMLDEAEREFRRVLELDEKAADAVFYLGLIALRRGETLVAEKHFRDALERGGVKAAVYNNMALVAEQLGRTDEALALLEEGLEKTSGHPKLHLAKAFVLLKLGDPANANTTLREYEASVGDDLPPLYYAARALSEALLGDVDSAAKIVSEGVERHPTSAPLVNNAGVIFERHGDIDQAAQLYERAFEEESALPQASKNIGDLLYRQGAYDEAAKAYERVVLTHPDLGDDVYAKLGNVYYKRRARDKAIEMWVRALELNPANEVVRTNLELVRGAAGEQ